jgi:sugar phosphate isomerase/epimerase
MKFAICNETFVDWPLERALAFAAECGYMGVEIAPFTLARDVRDITAAARAEIVRQSRAAGLEIVGLHWLLAKTEGFHITSPDQVVRQKTAEYFAALAQLCADLGGRILVCGSPQQRSLLAGVTPQQAVEYALDVFAAAVPALEANGVTVAMEPLGPSETDFLTTAAETRAFIERLGSPHVRLHLDCKAMACEATPIPQLIRENRDYLVHFHANDPNRQGPGFGTLDFVPIFQALDEIGYRDWVSVEVFDYSPGIERLAAESLRYMRRCLPSSK